MSGTGGEHREIPTRLLGRIGERVSAIGLGGWHLSLNHVDEPLSIRLVQSAIDRGITFLDNCWDYNEGQSELRMGKALQGGYRDRVFLMTKIDGRSKRAAARQLDESLRRLQTDWIDLVQHHEVLRFPRRRPISSPRWRMRWSGTSGSSSPIMAWGTARRAAARSSHSVSSI